MLASGVGNKVQLGQWLIAHGAVTPAQVEEALAEQARTNHRQLLGEILVEKGFCTENQVAIALGACYGVPYAKINPRICDAKVLDVLSREFCEEHAVLPLFRVHSLLTVAMNEPANLFLVDQIEQLTGYKVQVVCATGRDILATLKAYSPTENVFVIDDLIEDKGLADFEWVEQASHDVGRLEEAANQSSVVELVSFLLCDAVRSNASDIHIEPDEKALRVRYRVDGGLYEKMRPPYQMHAAIVARIKKMAELDIGQRRLAQDGNIRVLVEERPVDLRVSILPGNCGETVAIRVVDPQKLLFNLESLGFVVENLRRFRQLTASPHGLILVTGPAGSGKNTTLHAVLGELNREEVKLCTVEDPIECHIPGINQYEVSSSIGGQLAQTLRNVLRQDPDIVMISEIRDEDTARLAVQAALTGCLVLSTLHTPDAPSAVTRLLDLDVPPYLVGDALIGVLAQRMVRKICPTCKAAHEPTASVRRTVERLGQTVERYYRGMGCKQCRSTGTIGRIAIHELFIPDARIRELIDDRVTPSRLRDQALENGMVPLTSDGIDKVKAGIISIEEVLRSVQLEG